MGWACTCAPLRFLFFRHPSTRMIAVIRAFTAAAITCSAVLFPSKLYPFLSRALLWALNVEIVESVSNALDENCPIVFNHPMPFDHVVLMAALNKPFGFVVKAEYIFGPCRFIGRKLGCVAVQKQRTVDIMRSAMQSGTQLAIAPAGGQRSNSPYHLDEFKSGAFVISDYVIPVVIRYWPFDMWRGDETLMGTLWRRLKGNQLRCSVVVLPKMKADKDSVKHAMEVALRDTKITFPQNQRSVLLTFSSLAFFGSSAYHLIQRNKLHIAIGVLWVTATSVWYHSTGSANARFIDMIGNFILAPIYSSFAMMDGNIRPCIASMSALFGYSLSSTTLSHVFLVHIPVWLGFMAM